MKQRTIIWISMFILIALLPQVFSECCLNAQRNNGYYYCKDSKAGVTYDNCCGNQSICTEYVSGLCDEIAECKNPTTGCCCAGTAGIPVSQKLCESAGYSFYDIQNPAECLSMCARLPPETTCTSGWQISATPVAGQKKIELRVSTCRPVPEYTIRRCAEDVSNASLCTTIVANSVSTGTHIDDQIEWDKTYTYIVGKVVSGKPTDDINARVTIFSGNFECETHGDSQEKFCLPTEYYVRKTEFENAPVFKSENSETFEDGVTKRMSADPPFGLGPNFKNSAVYCQNNQLKQITSCQSGACVINDNSPSCIQFSVCHNVSSTDLFAGMYYTNKTCEYNGTGTDAAQKYCFFDRSETTIDFCYSCKPEMSCADYKSQYACEKDNCHLNRCGWKELNSEFNTGVCMDTKSGKNCEWCAKSGTETMENVNVFNKVFDACGVQKALALSTDYGKCLYTGGISKTCDETTCADYLVSDCSNFTKPILDNTNDFKQESNDMCGIGACRLFDVAGEKVCRKDADSASEANSKPDCENSNNTAACELDYFKPKTEMIPIKFNKGCPVNFALYVYDRQIPTQKESVVNGKPGYTTYFCFGSDCMNSPMGFLSSTTRNLVKLNNMQMTDDRNTVILKQLNEGQTTLYYYTTDPFGNVGLKRNITFPTSANCSYIEYDIDVR